MTLTLENLVNESGFRRDYLAEAIGMSKQMFGNKLKGRREFRDIEVERLAEVLEVHPRIVRRALPKVSSDGKKQ